MINNNTIIAAVGEFWDDEVRGHVYSNEVFSWNMASGERTQLPDLPESFINEGSDDVFGCCLNDGTFCVINGESWAMLSQDGHWEMNPNLQGRQLQAIFLSDSICKVFAGNVWIDLPPYKYINGIKINWRSTNCCKIVK